MRNLLIQLTPPLILTLYRKIKKSGNFNHHSVPGNSGMWSGRFPAWKDAIKTCTGYEHYAILEKCKSSLLKIKNGEAIYERDGVLFDKIEYSWPLLASLQRVAMDNLNSLSVLDFGGSLGTTYYQNRAFLSGLKKIDWHIVEQKRFVDEGKRYFEDEALKFFYTIDESVNQRHPNVVIASGVFQCLEFPFDVLDKILSIKSRFIIVDRTSFIDYPSDILMVENVPAEIYPASYPTWFFNEEAFLNKFKKEYKLIADFESFADPELSTSNNEKMYWKGFFFERL